MTKKKPTRGGKRNRVKAKEPLHLLMPPNSIHKDKEKGRIQRKKCRKSKVGGRLARHSRAPDVQRWTPRSSEKGRKGGGVSRKRRKQHEKESATKKGRNPAYVPYRSDRLVIRYGGTTIHLSKEVKPQGKSEFYEVKSQKRNT